MLLKNRFFCYFLIVLGAIAQGIGIGLFLDPYGIAPGGVMGIAIMISNFTGFQTGSLILLINLPLLAAAFFFFGRSFFVRTTVATFLVSVSVDIFSEFTPPSDDRIICAIAGGALIAFSLGIIFHAGGSTGGMDIIVRFLRKAFPHLKSGTIFLIIDGIICVFMGVVFKNVNNALYAFVALAVCSKLLDLILYGADEAKLVFIFTEKSEKIMKSLLLNLEVGASYLSGEGGFSGENKKIIMCAIKKSRFPKLSQIVKEIDDKSFMVVSSASEIYGKGFKKYNEILL